MTNKTRVLVIDDSVFVCETLRAGLSLDEGIDVVGTAGDPYSARDKIVELKPDVLTLDVEMPRMDGLEFLQKLMPQYPVPTIMVSAFTEKGARITLDALEAGAVDFVAKPRAGTKKDLNRMLMELRTKIKIASTVDVSHWKRRKNDLPVFSRIRAELSRNREMIIAIGASTGGTEAIKRVLTCLPIACPGIVIVQHMPEKFTAAFAERLNAICEMTVKEAENGDRIDSGKVFIAPGNRHMEIVRFGNGYEIKLKDTEPVSGHRPSVDVLMNSVARYAGSHARGILLTGMGKDGALGLREMKRSGAITFAQDQKSSIVFGMPGKAVEYGAVDYLVHIDDVAEAVLNSFPGEIGQVP